MSFGFWKQLKRPVSVLAPMSGYTDAAFRAIIAKYGKPDVMFTEFVPADGLCSVGQDNLTPYMQKTQAEHPIVVQLYGGNPDNYLEAAKYVTAQGFDGIDINMGCPARAVESRRGGSALIKDPPRAREIIEATVAGAGSVPVSIKTRIGYEVDEIETWLPWLMESKPAAITLHARTRRNDNDVPAKWDVIARAVSLAKELAPDVHSRPLIIGNGDVRSVADVQARAAETGCDGVMVGRGVIGNPWLFSDDVGKHDLTLRQVLDVMVEHAELYIEIYGDNNGLDPMKKHFKAYTTGLNRPSGLRQKLMQVYTLAELETIVRNAVMADPC